MNTVRELLLLAAIAVLMLTFMGAVLNAAEMWHPTPEANHHKACVKVRIGDRAGSGTVIAVSNKYCYVITAGHVAMYHKECTITWLNGAKAQGTVIRSQVQPDLAFLQIPHNDPDWQDIPYIPVAATHPAQGVMCEVTGYGLDGSDELRHFYATVRGYEKHGGALTLDTSVCSGDSGGGVIVNGELVGVIQGGSYRTDAEGQSRGQGMYVWPALGPNTTQVRDFMTLCGWDRICGPAGCKPLAPWGGIIKREDPGREKPPITLPPSQPLVPIKPPVDPCRDIRASITALEAECETLKGQISGNSDKVAPLSGRLDLFDGKLLGIEKKTENRFDLLIDAGQKSHQANEKQNSAISSLSSGQSQLGSYVGLAALLGLTGPAGIAVGAAGWIAVRRLKKRIKGPTPEYRDRLISDVGRDDDKERWRDLAERRQVEINNLKGRLTATIDRGECELENEIIDNLNGRLDDLTAKFDERGAEVVSLRDRVKSLKTENHYVSVPVQNSEAQSYKKACRQVTEKYPEAANIVQLVEGIAQQIEHGQDVIRGHKSSPLTKEN